MQHKHECEVRVFLGVVCELEQPVRGHVETREEVIFKLCSLLIQLNFCQMLEVVVSFSDEFFGGEECIH